MMNRREFSALAGAGVAGFFFPSKSHGDARLPESVTPGIPESVEGQWFDHEGMARLIAEFPQGPESLLFYNDYSNPLGRHISLELHECWVPSGARFPNSGWSISGTTLNAESPGYRLNGQPEVLIRWVVDVDHIDTVRFKRVNQPMISYRNLGKEFWYQVIDGRFDRTVFQLRPKGWVEGLRG